MGVHMQLSIKRLFSAGLGVVVGLLGLAGWGVYNLGQALQEATQANTSRYNSYLLADELRQSSDDLTRLARTYVLRETRAGSSNTWRSWTYATARQRAPMGMKRSTGIFVLQA